MEMNCILSLLCKHYDRLKDDGQKEEVLWLLNILDKCDMWTFSDELTTLENIKNNIPERNFRKLLCYLLLCVDILEDPTSEYTMQAYMTSCGILLEVKEIY